MAILERQKDNSLLLANWQEGIGQSILDNFSDMLEVNIDSPGIVSAGYKFNKQIYSRAGITFTADAGTDCITPAESLTQRGIYNYQAVRLTTTGTLPAGLSTNTTYYVKAGFGGSSLFFLSTTLKNAIDGTYIDITSAGTGVHTLTILAPAITRGVTRDSYGNFYVLDSNQRLWFSNGDGVTSYWYLLEGNTSAGAGNGIVFYKGYILIWGNAKIDALHEINDIGTALTWHNDFASATSILNTVSAGTGKVGAVPFLSLNDDAIYFGNGNPSGKGTWRIGLLEEVAGETFDPNTSSTFSCVADAIVVPNLNGQGFATVIREINEQLIIGTNSDQVFLWDKKSPSFTSVMRCPEAGVRLIEVVGGEFYIFPGVDGNCYIANTVGISRSPIFRIPEQVKNQYYRANAANNNMVSVNYTASAVYLNEILFAVEIYGYCYLMSYNFNTKKLIKKNISSYGERLQSATNETTGNISLIFTNGDNIFIGSYYRTVSPASYSYAIESLLHQDSIGSGYTYYRASDNYQANIITSLFPYGATYNKGTIRKIVVNFTRALAQYQGIKIYYRLDDSSAFTLIATADYDTYGAVKDIEIPLLITDIIDIQFKIELRGQDMTSPRLKAIIFKP